MKLNYLHIPHELIKNSFNDTCKILVKDFLSIIFGPSLLVSH